MKNTKTFYARLSTITFVLAIVIAILTALEFLVPPAVKSTNLVDHIAPSAFHQIEITFNRSMDRRSVEQAFQLQPPLEGSFLWRNNKLIYQLKELPQYHQTITLNIDASARDTNGKTFTQPFTRQIKTAPAQILYLGSSGDETDRLILYNLQDQHQQILTNPDFTIEQFANIPNSKEILLLGAPGNQQPELYLLNPDNSHMRQLTSDPRHLNNKFTLAPTGEHVALSRIQLSETGTYLSGIELWLASTTDYQFEKYQPDNAQGSDVYFSFDGSHLLYFNQNYAFELAPITATSPEEALFIGKEFNHSYGFHPSRPIIIFNNLDNTDLFTIDNDLILFYGDGSQKMVPFEDGITRDSTFTPDGESVITIFSRQEEAMDDPLSFYPLRIFHLYQYDLENEQITQLTSDSGYSEEEPVIASNGQYILFRRFDTTSHEVAIDPAYREVADSLGTITTGELWLYNLRTGELLDLGIQGKQARWYDTN